MGVTEIIIGDQHREIIIIIIAITGTEITIEIKTGIILRPSQIKITGKIATILITGEIHNQQLKETTLLHKILSKITNSLTGIILVSKTSIKDLILTIQIKIIGKQTIKINSTIIGNNRINLILHLNLEAMDSSFRPL